MHFTVVKEKGADRVQRRRRGRAGDAARADEFGVGPLGGRRP